MVVQWYFAVLYHNSSWVSFDFTAKKHGEHLSFPKPCRLGILHLDCPSEACGNGDYRLGAADETTKVESVGGSTGVAGEMGIFAY